MTILFIFGSAYLLAAMGCGASQTTKTAAPVPNAEEQQVSNADSAKNPEVKNKKPEVQLPALPAEIPVKSIQRHCSEEEFKKVQKMKSSVDSLNKESLKTKKPSPQFLDLISRSLMTVKNCKALADQFKNNACRQLDIISSNYSYYDEHRILKMCRSLEKFVLENKSETPPISNPKPPVTPKPPKTPPTEPSVPSAPPVVPNVPAPGNSTGVGECRQDVVAQLSKLTQLEDQFKKASSIFSSPSQWAYNAQTILAASAMTKFCEPLIQFFQQKSCERKVTENGQPVIRQYNEANLRKRCETARTYFYDFVQNSKTLIYPNADLYFDMTAIPETVFETGYFKDYLGRCSIENRTENTVHSQSGYVLLKDARLEIANKMIAFDTTEGLTITCYGLNVNTAASKSEIVKLLNQMKTPVRLKYVLK